MEMELKEETDDKEPFPPYKCMFGFDSEVMCNLLRILSKGSPGHSGSPVQPEGGGSRPEAARTEEAVSKPRKQRMWTEQGQKQGSPRREQL